MRFSSLLMAVLAASLIPAAQADTPLIPAKSEIRFGFKQMNVPVEGTFKKFTGTFDFDPAKPEAGKADLQIDLGSIDLGSPEGETEAKGKTFFNIAAFPQARFVASGFKPLGNNRYQVSGKLTIKGISRDIHAPFTVKPEAGGFTTEGTVTIQRLAFKIGEGDWADEASLSNDVQVKFKLALAKKTS
ncbi:polyisoprenoid-binding protein YceI [Chitinivorax tropicus]|uniref:Polyisoprenoid-binding protein YceI n=1 Tax=Chitinivorax tropicus TaxID=714531 RepID=A0A840MPI0_9PROT|nr:YceI family protein [Chitinivorax tropicus]MBB5018999.1 polyisoprenoid-binding protein YceI [Chitinivorax tropicus]